MCTPWSKNFGVKCLYENYLGKWLYRSYAYVYETLPSLDHTLTFNDLKNLIYLKLLFVHINKHFFLSTERMSLYKKASYSNEWLVKEIKLLEK